MQDEHINQDSILFQLPQDVFKNIPLNIEDIKNLRLTCRGFSFFRPILHKNQSKNGDAYLLMDKINKFHLEQVKTIAKHNPHCMFEKICYETRDNVKEDSTELKAHSPLQQAFKAYDSYTWKVLYEIIKDNSELLKQYNRQMLEVQDHFDIQPLMNAYNTYLKSPTKEHSVMTRREQDALPMHMIFEMCRVHPDAIHRIDNKEIIKKEYLSSQKCSWLIGYRNEPDSYKISNPPPAKIIILTKDRFYNYTYNIAFGFADIFNNIEEYEKGQCKGMLVRGAYEQFVDLRLFPDLETATCDKYSFDRLFTTRKNEFEEHKNQMFLQHGAKINL